MIDKIEYEMTVFNDQMKWFIFKTDDIDHLEAEKRRVAELGLNYKVEKVYERETT